MNSIQTAKGSVVIENTEEKFPTDAYFDFAECFGPALLSMGTLTVKARWTRRRQNQFCRCGQPKPGPK
jgi:hypothetical protein